MKTQHQMKKKSRLLAFILVAALLIASAALLVAPTLAAPGDLTETFVSPYPVYAVNSAGIGEGYLVLPKGSSMVAISAGTKTWASSFPEIVEVSYDTNNPATCTITGIAPGVASVVNTTPTGSAGMRPFVVTDDSMISSYRIPGGTAGGEIAAQNSTYQIDVRVRLGSVPGGEVQYNPNAGLIAWFSDDPDIATVDADGLVTAMVGDGAVNIRGEFTDPWGFKRTIAFLVVIGNGDYATAAPKDINEVIDSPYPPYSPLPPIGGHGYVNISVDIPYSTASPGAFMWWSSDTRVVKVEPVLGDHQICTVMPSTLGVADVASFTPTGGLDIRSIASVNNNNISAYLVSHGASGLRVASGGTGRLDVYVRRGATPGLVGLYNYLTTPAISQIVWRSDNDAIATVDSVSGLVTGVSNGAVDIRGDFTDPWGFKHTIAYPVVVGVGGGTAVPMGMEIDPSGEIYRNRYGYDLFTATVPGAVGVPQGVTWSVSGRLSALTSISPNGLLCTRLPFGTAMEPDEFVTVRATSEADPTVFAEVKVLLAVDYAEPGFLITPAEPVEMQPDSAKQFTATLWGGGDITGAVVWQVIDNTSAGTAISAGGLLTIAPDENADYIVVRAVYNGEQAYVRVDIIDTSISGGDVIDLSDSTPPVSGTGWTYADNVYTVTGNVTIINSTTTRRVVVQSGANVNITLDNIIIDRSSGVGENNANCAFDISGATVTLTLIGDNILAGGEYRAALRVPTGATLTVEGAGSLNAIAKTTSDENAGGGAGIGGNRIESCGTVIVNGGTVKAHSSFASGIGGGINGSGGNIIVNGGSVEADSVFGNGIGGGNGRSPGNTFVIIPGAPGGSVKITGGVVNAYSTYSAGIGGGRVRNSRISFGDFEGAVVEITGGTLIASGGQQNINSMQVEGRAVTYPISVHNASYIWWSSTTASDPGGPGNPPAYMYSETHKFIKIISH